MSTRKSTSILLSKAPGAIFLGKIDDLVDQPMENGEYLDWQPTQHTISQKDFTAILNIPSVRTMMEEHLRVYMKPMEIVTIVLPRMFIKSGPEELAVQSVRIPDITKPSIVCHWPPSTISSKDITVNVPRPTGNNYLATIDKKIDWIRYHEEENKNPGMHCWKPTEHYISKQDLQHILNNPAVKNLIAKYSKMMRKEVQGITIVRLPGMYVTSMSVDYPLHSLQIPDISEPFIICSWPPTPIHIRQMNQVVLTLNEMGLEDESEY